MASNQILQLIDEEGRPRRGSQRRSVMLTAKLVTSACEYDVRIRDVSATGARIEGGALPPQGTDVILKRGYFSVFGRLVWTGDRMGGILFDEPRSEDMLLEELKGLPAAREEEDISSYRRPGFDHGTARHRWSDGRGWIEPRLPASRA